MDFCPSAHQPFYEIEKISLVHTKVEGFLKNCTFSKRLIFIYSILFHRLTIFNEELFFFSEMFSLTHTNLYEE